MKTPKQEIEEIAAIEHDDPTGLYDNVSVEGAILAFAKYLTQKRQEMMDDCNLMKRDLYGIGFTIDEILEDLKE